MHSAVHIAIAFIQKGIEEGHYLNQIDVYDRIYFAQGVHLARYGTPLFHEKIEAQKHGPRVESLYPLLRAYGSDLITDFSRVPLAAGPAQKGFDALSKRAWDTIHYTWEATKPIDRLTLKTWTIAPDSPWHQTYYAAHPKVEIPNDLVKAYFEKLLYAPNLKIGDVVAGEGVFIGEWEPVDEKGRSLGQVFNLFSERYDITDPASPDFLKTFNEVVQWTSGVKNWFGHDGGKFENEKDLIDAIKSGAYKGEWFLPTSDIAKDNLFENRNKGALRNTFVTKASKIGAHWYWTLNGPARNPDGAYYIDFSNGDAEDWQDKNNLRLSARLVRAVPRPGKR